MKNGGLIAIIMLVLFGAMGNYLRFSERSSQEPAHFDRIPLTADGYTGEEQRFSEESYEILQADTSTLRMYFDTDGYKYWLFIAYFESQEYGAQIHSPRHCLPGGGWQIENIEPYDLELNDGTSKTINRLRIAANQYQQLMLYWYETRGGAIRDEFGLKFDLMKNSLLLRPTDAAIVRLTVQVNPGENFDGATKRALAYLNRFHPDMMAALPFD